MPVTPQTSHRSASNHMLQTRYLTALTSQQFTDSKAILDRRREEENEPGVTPNQDRHSTHRCYLSLRRAGCHHCRETRRSVIRWVIVRVSRRWRVLCPHCLRPVRGPPLPWYALLLKTESFHKTFQYIATL